MKDEKDVIFDDEDRVGQITEFTSPEQLYQDLIYCVKKYHPSDDISMIERAYNIASEAHKDGVSRASLISSIR